MKTSNGCCGGSCAAVVEPTPVKVLDSTRQLYENDNFTVGVRAGTGKYCLFNKFTGVEEDGSINNYVEALYMAEQYNYALINKTYVMEKIDLGAMLNLTGDNTVQ